MKEKSTLTEILHGRVSNGAVNHVDLSDLDLSAQADMFIAPVPALAGTEQLNRMGVLKSWTDSVIWPSADKMPKNINPKKILDDAKTPTEMTDMHARGITGKNIGIAIIDQRLYRDHSEYKNQIKHYEVIGRWPHGDTTTPDYHGSLVTGIAVGKTTGTAPDADLYYFAANNWPPMNRFVSAITKLTDQGLKMMHRKYFNMAIRRILEINKSLPDHQKIRFLSCSWGARDDQFRAETDALFDECERNGVMVLGGFYHHTMTGFTPCDKRFAIEMKNQIGIPTNGKTTPYYLGGYYYTRLGGASSTYPYLAGVFACALQGNQIFCTRPAWQDELMRLVRDTAQPHPSGGKIINPTAIVDAVTRIARDMEMNLIQQKSIQHDS